MALVFCCPECGASIRATRNTFSAVVSCPMCKEPVRVPRTAYPQEAIYDVPTLRVQDADVARGGILYLTRSLWFFAASSFTLLTILSIWLVIGSRPAAAVPAWTPNLILGLILTWFACSWTGCYLRIRGYRACERLAAAVMVDGWVRVAVWGTWLVALGQFSVVVLYLARVTKALPPEVIPIGMAGLLCGAVGMALEFGFLTVLHRLLWEAAGWQAATRTGHFAITFIASSIAGMAVLSIGFMGLTSVQWQQGAVESPVRIMLTGLVALCGGLITLVAMRYRHLLLATRQVLAQPEPYPIEQKSTTQPSGEA